MRDYNEAIRLNPNPDAAATFTCRGEVWKKKGEYKKAIEDHDAALRINPKMVLAFNNRGVTWIELGEYDAAIRDYDEATRLNPQAWHAFSNRAWLRATCLKPKCRDAAAALRDATRACELTQWKHPEPLQSLAAAYAEAGKFDDAVKWQKKALEFTNSERVRDRLELYEKKMPCRQ